MPRYALGKICLHQTLTAMSTLRNVANLKGKQKSLFNMLILTQQTIQTISI